MGLSSCLHCKRIMGLLADVFGDDQLYIMFEFGDGGCDLDSCKVSFFF